MTRFTDKVVFTKGTKIPFQTRPKLLCHFCCRNGLSCPLQAPQANRSGGPGMDNPCATRRWSARSAQSWDWQSPPPGQWWSSVINAVLVSRAMRGRTTAEIQAKKAASEKLSLISVVVDGTQFDGQADHIARLLNAMKQTVWRQQKTPPLLTGCHAPCCAQSVRFDYPSVSALLVLLELAWACGTTDVPDWTWGSACLLPVVTVFDFALRDNC